MEDHRILTQHPAGKKGVRIARTKYDAVFNFILEKVKDRPGLTFSDLGDLAEQELAPTFDGKVLWYITTVKLDMEARQVIERVPRTSPHQLRLVQRS
ncbi:MAG: hypothetical protein AAFU60_15810 [Bacteroidota bacterium]